MSGGGEQSVESAHRSLGDDLRDAVLLLVDEWEQISGSDTRAVEQWRDAAAWLKRTVDRVYPPAGGESDG